MTEKLARQNGQADPVMVFPQADSANHWKSDSPTHQMFYDHLVI